jgi:hypothetical protein
MKFDNEVEAEATGALYAIAFVTAVAGVLISMVTVLQ